MGVLFHFSDRGDVAVFEPRSPTGHPESEPLVFAIDAWHSPLYYFPRDCPRTGVWPVEATSAEDRDEFRARFGEVRMLLLIKKEFEPEWRTANLFRYSFEPNEHWVNTNDHGCWVSRRPQTPELVERVCDFPAALEVLGCRIEVLEDLAALTQELGTRTWHVSAIRHRLLPGFSGPPGTPVKPP